MDDSKIGASVRMGLRSTARVRPMVVGDISVKCVIRSELFGHLESSKPILYLYSYVMVAEVSISYARLYCTVFSVATSILLRVVAGPRES